MVTAGLPFSDAYQAGDLLFCSGQIAWVNDQLVEGFDEQVRASIKNLSDVLENHGASLNNLVKVNLFLDNMDDFWRMNEIYAEEMGDHRPARACVEVARLPRNALFEIEGVAYLG